MSYFTLGRGTSTEEIRTLTEEVGNFLGSAQIFLKEFGGKIGPKSEKMMKFRKKNNG